MKKLSTSKTFSLPTDVLFKLLSEAEKHNVTPSFILTEILCRAFQLDIEEHLKGKNRRFNAASSSEMVRKLVVQSAPMTMPASYEELKAAVKSRAGQLPTFFKMSLMSPDAQWSDGSRVYNNETGFDGCGSDPIALVAALYSQGVTIEPEVMALAKLNSPERS